MAKWYDKESDIVMILDPRQGAGVPLGFKDDAWTEMRMGGFISAVNASDDNGAWTTEDIVVSSVYDQFMCGIKNSSDQGSVLGEATCDFIGMSGLVGNTTSIRDFFSTTGVLFGNLEANTNRYSVANGATVNGVNGAATASKVFNIGTAAKVVAATEFSRFFGLRIVINNRGLSSQTISMSFANRNAIHYTDTSKSNLQSLLTNMTGFTELDTPAAITANDGASAFPIPDSLYIRNHSILNRLRLHNVMAMKIA